MSDKALAEKFSVLGKMGVYAQDGGIYSQDGSVCLKLSEYHYSALNEYSFWVNGIKAVSVGASGQLMWPDEQWGTQCDRNWVIGALDSIFLHWLSQPKRSTFSMKSYQGDIYEIVMYHIALGVYSHHVDNLTEYDLGNFLVRIDKEKFQCSFFSKQVGNVVFSLSDLDKGAKLSVDSPVYEVTGELIIGLLNQFTDVLCAWYRGSGLVDMPPVKGLQVDGEYFVNPTYLVWLLVRQRDKTSSSILGLVTAATHRIAEDLAKAKGWDASTIHVDGLCIYKGTFGFNMHQVTKVRITEAL